MREFVRAFIRKHSGGRPVCFLNSVLKNSCGDRCFGDGKIRFEVHGAKGFLAARLIVTC
jgi:hypothetical protein